MRTFLGRHSLVAMCAGLMALTLMANEAAAVVPQALRTSSIDGLKVRNAQGQELGKVRDLVIDLENGKVIYAALDFGGFIGIGDKLFAVPWSSFKCHLVGDDKYLILDVSKDRLEKAPGFDKSHWPAAADPQWSQVDQYYSNTNTTAP